MQCFARIALFLFICAIQAIAGPVLAGFRVVHSPGTSSKLLVFIHGLRGDAKETFWAGPPHQTWFDIIKSDRTALSNEPPLSSYAIGLVDYPAGAGDGLSARDVAMQIKSDLLNSVEFRSYPEIYFVTHSLGGIALKEMLLDTFDNGSAHLLSRTKAIFFIAVPEGGSRWASMASRAPYFFSRTIFDLQSIAQNSFLQSMQGRWRGLMSQSPDKRPTAYCAFETKPTNGLMVVPQEFSQRSCDVESAMNEDHSSIVKPTSSVSNIHTWLRQSLADIYKSSLDRAFGSVGREADTKPNDAKSSRVINTPDRPARQVLALQGHSSAITAIAAVDEESFITLGSDNRAVLWNMYSGDVKRSADLPRCNSGIAVYDEATVLVYGCDDGLVREVNGKSLTISRERKLHAGAIRSLSISPDRQFAISVGNDDLFRLWKLPSWERLRQFDGKRASPAAADFSPDKKRVLLYWSSTALEVWRLDSLDRPERSISIAQFSHFGLFDSSPVLFSADGKSIVYGGINRIGSISGERDVATPILTAEGNNFFKLALSPQLDTLAATWHKREIGTDKSFNLAVIDLTAPKPPDIEQSLIPGFDSVLAFSANGKRIITGHSDGTIRVWVAY